MAILPPTYSSTVNAFPETTQIRARGPPVSQPQIITVKNAPTKTERLRYHLRLQLAGVVEQTSASSGRNAGSGWQFVPPCLISTTSGALSPHIFHKTLEKIHCDSTLYPHLEEEEAFQEFVHSNLGEQNQSWQTTISKSLASLTETNYCTVGTAEHGHYDSHSKHIIVELDPDSKGSQRPGTPKMQYGTIRPPSLYASGPSVWSSQGYRYFRNRGRLSSNRWSFFQEWHCEEGQFAEDSGLLLPPTSMSWDYPVTSSPFRDFESEDQERLLVFGSYLAVVVLILLSFWVLTHHNHLH